MGFNSDEINPDENRGGGIIPPKVKETIEKGAAIVFPIILVSSFVCMCVIYCCKHKIKKPDLQIGRAHV